ncbi:methyltransferase domain-containing protein [Methylocystis parvus]|uniref:class I SAM-dependent methyltransferase n=1 Tax=Methylocystis parvus TaxID=134 RepID=UPI003C75EE86
MSITEKFGHVSNDEWLRILTRSVEEPVIDGEDFPRFPHPSRQGDDNGDVDREAIVRAHALWIYAEGYCRAFGSPLTAHSTVLDVGCGWGALTRLFARDVAAENIHGVDANPDAIAMCSYLGVPGWFTQMQPGAALPFPNDSFDVIVAGSVFAHLPESLAYALLCEMSRVCKKRGVVAMAVEDESFFDAADPADSARAQRLSEYAEEIDAMRASAVAGDYVYLPPRGARAAEVYGDAVIPRQWLHEHCWPLFNFLRYDSARPPIHRAVVVGRKEA